MYAILEHNPQLLPFASEIEARVQRWKQVKKDLLPKDTTLAQFANGHLFYGIHRLESGWVYREWAPAAQQLWLTGDFNDWNPTSHPLTLKDNGVWELVLPEADALWPGCKVKTLVKHNGSVTEHIPVYARYVVQDPDTYLWCAEVWAEDKPFPWTPFQPDKAAPLFLYEAHVGMAQEEGRIGSYREFADNILPWIHSCGYTAVQLMAVMEHPYYASFGYQVSNFFAPSSRFGTPTDLKYLVDKAHQLGIRVILDLVHSHAVGNTAEGIHMFDGTVWQFFHDGPKGDHPAWGTKLFNYGKHEVLHFLLSNVKYWLEEYHLDGFRFDGVTSMLYQDHGLGDPFDRDERYFSGNVDADAVVYLQLANELIKEVTPTAVTMAEDVSGMPGIGLPIPEGGIGFDYRLGMGIPDLWDRVLKIGRDEDWPLDEIWGSLCLRRPGEQTVAYVECHDQSIVGDKAVMFRLADANMYTDMSVFTQSLVIDRAIALHKLLRLLTAAAGGDAYLNFMGNEFGHPEWVDFPREGNGNSYHYCRRQWHLVHDTNLRYRFLAAFDRAMLDVIRDSSAYRQFMPDQKLLHRDDLVLAFERGGYLYVFNFHPTSSYPDYLIPVSQGRDYELVLSSDDAAFGGQDRVAHIPYSSFVPGRKDSALRLYLPARTGLVLRPVAEPPKKAAGVPEEKVSKKTGEKSAVKQQ